MRGRPPSAPKFVSVLAVASIAAGLIPARLASQIDPSLALRYEQAARSWMGCHGPDNILLEPATAARVLDDQIFG